jgi:Carboxypeptidase regulatory-like domain
MRLFVSALLVGFVAVGYIAVGSPQIANPTTAGILVGQVVDGSGAAVAGANVELWVGSRADRTTTTDSGGRFRFERVVAGSYEVRVSMTGFRPVSTSVVVVKDRPIPALRLALLVPSRNAALAEASKEVANAGC